MRRMLLHHNWLIGVPIKVHVDCVYLFYDEVDYHGIKRSTEYFGPVPILVYDCKFITYMIFFPPSFLIYSMKY